MLSVDKLLQTEKRKPVLNVIWKPTFHLVLKNFIIFILYKSQF